MQPLRLERWVRLIYETQDEESPCSELFDLVAEYVDREMRGEAVAESMPHVKHTLDVCRDQCRACFEEYEVLRSLARLEADGRAPSVDDLRQSL